MYSSLVTVGDEVLVRKCVLVDTATDVCAVCRYLRDAAVGRKGRLEKIDREVCASVCACVGLVKPSYLCTYFSRPTRTSFKGQGKEKHALVQCQME